MKVYGLLRVGSTVSMFLEGCDACDWLSRAVKYSSLPWISLSSSSAGVLH